MSAGICIMNKNAIALAADSAVTIGNHLAIHNTANKLFAISKTAPIGVIIYANADLMYIPMEIILKQYKKHLNATTFSTLDEYVNDFFEFLVQNIDLFHFKQNEQNLVMDICNDLLNGLYGDYKLLIQRKVEKVKKELTANELRQIQNEAIHMTEHFIDSLQPISNLKISQYIIDTYFSDIKQCIAARFEWLNNEGLDDFVRKVCSIYDKQFFRNGYVGLAFTGYGNNAIFPKMIHMHISGIINNKVRYIINEDFEINENQDAMITPFAQTDVMQTFLFGINDSFIDALSNEIPKQIQHSLQNMDISFFVNGKKEIVEQELLKATGNIIEQIIHKAQTQYLQPITQAVATLPIEELALLAESMINITSLRRKVALDNNIGTVGGPIDVAIISKNDGFIWMKRKHYFDRVYNPQYFYSHYMLSGGEPHNGKKSVE